MESKEITLVWLIRLFLRVYLLWKYNTKHPMLYYIDNNAQLTFYSLLSCNVTIQHYEKHVRIGKVRVLLFRVLLHLRHLFFSFFFTFFPSSFFFFFILFYFVWRKRPDITEREDTYNRRETLQSEKLQTGTEKRKYSGVLFNDSSFFFFTFH